VTSARTRLLLVVALFVVVDLGPLHALLTGQGLRASQWTAVVFTNLALLAGVGIYLALRGRTRPELRMVATAPLVPSSGEPVLDRLHGNEYVVRGEVEDLADGALLLRVADRRVRVLLEGRPVPAGPGAGVEVRGTMVG
jgi:hypothetical protein